MSKKTAGQSNSSSVNGEETIWGIHGGRTGDANTLFLKKKCVAVGWHQMGSLTKLPDNRDAFKLKVQEVYPNAKPGAIPNFAGQLFRFTHRVQVGDLIVYPSKQDRHVHIGRITSPYTYDPSKDEKYPHLRSVDWLQSVPRTALSQGALYEIGSAMSFFGVKKYADEYIAILEGETPSKNGKDDETVAVVAEEIEENTRDFILKRLAKELKGTSMEMFVAHLLNLMGYKTRMTSAGTDGGVDVIAHKDELGFEPPIIKVQVKATEGSVGDPVVSALYGKVGNEEYGLLITLGSYTKQARDFATSKTNLRLIDGDELVRLTLDHYDDFDSKYKGIIPLKMVYVPQVVSDSDD